jgi:phenylpropionate dioxygenase-like ring-hydroxylating dioxygenase large terminal subunit
MSESPCQDRLINDQWYAIAAIDECPGGDGAQTTLLGVPIGVAVLANDEPAAWRLASPGQHREPLPARAEYGYLWTTLGDPDKPLFAIPEFFEPDRRTFNAATFGVHVSGPRAIDNFLDMGHLPFVHEGVLGAQPYTEIVDYNVDVSEEILATKCQIFQPKAAAASNAGATVEYTFRVPHPMCALLYKTTPSDADRLDVLGLFVQPLREDYIRAHLFNCLLDDENTVTEIRRFQQGILAQDKPILENQLPKLLPLAPGAETPVRADKTGIMYRRWLADLGVSYGVTR